MPQTPTRIGIACITFVLASVVLAACTAPGAPQGPPSQMMGGAPGPQTGQPSPNTSAGAFSSIGEQIWLTGVGGSGRPIAHSSPQISQGALMMGGGGCASCHGQNGRGGTIQMMMGPAIKAPDVTYSALITEGFTAVTIARAITQGLDEADKPLDQAMPRWQMDTGDVEATIAYLKVLGAE